MPDVLPCPEDGNGDGDINVLDLIDLLPDEPPGLVQAPTELADQLGQRRNGESLPPDYARLGTEGNRPAGPGRTAADNEPGSRRGRSTAGGHRPMERSVTPVSGHVRASLIIGADRGQRARVGSHQHALVLTGMKVR